MAPCSLLRPAHPATAPTAFHNHGRTAVRVACASGGGSGASGSGNGSKEEPSLGAGLKAVWVGAEAFGNVVGAMKGSQQQQQVAASSTGPLTREQVLQSLREDFDNNYFVSGERRLLGGLATPFTIFQCSGNAPCGAR